jgi:hypothetical protein
MAEFITNWTLDRMHEIFYGTTKYTRTLMPEAKQDSSVESQYEEEVR